MATKTVLVTAASGQIGTHLIPQLLSDTDYKLVLPTTNAKRLESKLSSRDRISIEEGDLKDPVWLENIMKKHHVDNVFLCLTTTHEFIITLNFLDAMKRAGTVKHLVYLSAAGDYVSEEGMDTVFKTTLAAHVVLKPVIERVLKVSDFPWTHTVVGPTYFFDNDFRAKEAFLKSSTYSVPAGGKGASRVSAADIATVVVKAFTQPEKLAGKKVCVGSLHYYTAEEVVKIWSDALGKPISNGGLDEKTLDGFENLITTWSKDSEGAMAAGWARDLRIMYHDFAVHGFGMTEEQYKFQLEVLGREPADYAEFVKETAKAWLAEK